MTSPFTRLRLRLTAWYAGSFAVLLVLLGLALLTRLRQQGADQLHRDLAESVTEVLRATGIGMSDGLAPDSALVQSAIELDAPEHRIYVLDAAGRTLVPGAMITAPIRHAVDQVRSAGSAEGIFATGAQHWHFYGRSATVGRRRYALLALTDAEWLGRQQANLVRLLLILGGGAAIPVLVGGYALARLSARPVEESVERIRRFSAESAHELRTPVSIIRARAELALTRPRENGEYVEVLREISTEAQRLGALVADLLALSRWESGDQRVEPQLVFVDDLVAGAVDAAGQVAGARGVILERGRTDDSAVSGDPALLRQVLLILLDNAVKFSRPGDRVTVDVSGEGDEVVVVVVDRGMGIDPHDLPHVFERFFRSAWSRAHGGGAGLGLTIADRIVAAHGGRLAIASRPGEGTRVELRLHRRTGMDA